jgi:hypothetical protein
VKRLVVLLSLVFCLPAVAHADGCPASTCGTANSSEALPGSNLFVVRPNGPQGSLIAYDTATGTRRFTLPQGRLSGDGRTFFSWAFAKTGTTIARYDTANGRFAAASRVPGRAIVAAVSATGDRVALNVLGRRNVTRFAILDARRGTVTQRIALRGAYEAEALSPDGRRLFLIHWNRNGYDLRNYDFARAKLRPTTLAEPDEKMSGSAATAIASRDGHWLLTLYVKGDGGSFVHALDLRTGIAHCIDLPWQARQFAGPATAALTVSPDGNKLYLANAQLGRVAVVDLRGLRVTRNVSFAPVAARAGLPLWPTAAVTRGGRMLGFAAGRSAWLYDTAYGVVRGPFAAATEDGALVTGLGFTPDGHRLTALRMDERRVAFDAATGRRVEAVRSPAEIFTVRTGGLGPLVGYDAGSAGPRFLLPGGRVSADGSRYFASISRSPGSTAIESYSPATGRLLRVHHLAGRWNLGAVSASGATIAVADHARGVSTVKVLDAATGRVRNSRTLRGVYTLDAVTDAGDKLFLIQHYRHGHYAVRALSFRTGRLWTATLREKGKEEQPVMTGQAAGQLASTDGNWLLTLYLDTKKRSAFVHALNLRAAYAVCIDLPSEGHALGRLRDYSLAFAPDGGVYATNGALGVLAHVDLERQSVTDTTYFSRPRASGGWAASALSRNGRMLYFASGARVWRYDTAFDVIRGPYVAPRPVVGLVFSRDGRKVFAPRVDGGVISLDAAKGMPLTA